MGVLQLLKWILEKKAGWVFFSPEPTHLQSWGWCCCCPSLRGSWCPSCHSRRERNPCDSSGCCLPQLCPHNQTNRFLLPSWSWEELCSLVPWVLPCTDGGHAEEWEHPLDVVCGDTQLGEGRQGLGQAVLVMCQLSGASRPQPWFQLLAPCPSCCMEQPWAGQSWEHCLVVSTDGLLLSFLLQQERSAAGGGERGCPGPLLCGGAQPLPRLPEIISPWNGLKYSLQIMHPLLITQNCNWKVSFSLHGMTQLNGLLSAEM